MTTIDFSNTQANFDMGDLDEITRDTDEILFLDVDTVSFTSLNGHNVTIRLDASAPDDLRITSVEISLAGTDPALIDVLITGLNIPTSELNFERVIDFSGISGDEAFAAQLWASILDGETDIIAPIGDFETATYSDFLTLDSGIHFGEATTYRGTFTATITENGEGKELGGNAVYFGGDTDFLGAVNEFNGDAGSVLDDATLFGGNDTIIFADAPIPVSDDDEAELFSVFIQGDAFSVSDSATLIGGDDLIDLRAMSTQTSISIFGDYETADGSTFIDGGDDTLFGSLTVSSIIVGDGGSLNSDIIFVGGNDTLYGGNADDLLFGDTGNGGANAVALAPTLSLNAPGEAQTQVGGKDILYAGAGNDELFGGGGHDTLFGGEGDDSLFGEHGDDLLYGGTGTNELFGGQGDDVFFLEGVSDTAQGGAGDDVFVMGTGTASISDGDGFDTVSYFDIDAEIIADFGNEGTSIVTSVAFSGDHALSSFELYEGSDTARDRVTTTSSEVQASISTNGGNDVVNSLGNNDNIDLGAGNDLVRASAGPSAYVGGSGLDTISYATSEVGVRIDLRDNEASGGRAEGDLIDGFERVNGSNGGEDLLLGTDRGNILKGLGGDDRFSARDGNDKLFGGGGEDFLDAGAGRDQLFGGSGADTFHFDKGHGVDIIKDFENNVDRIEIDGFGQDFNFRDFARQRDDGVLIDFGDGDFLLVEDALIGQLNNDLIVV